MGSKLSPLLLPICLVALAFSEARANAPAPWAVCDGKREGDSCASSYYPNGRCVRQPAELCSRPRNAVGTCLSCESSGKRGGCTLGRGAGDGGAGDDWAPYGTLLPAAALLALALWLRRRR
ncbi:MAG: hypothetical protein IT371_23210 [Deltaproteobacteria bacterium]|nr:hypothetical protein [Deltaproteobacteria bacterium]